MIWYKLCNEESNVLVNYFPQFIGIMGTLLGTFLGWLLKFLQDTIGKTEVIIEHFENFQDASKLYAFYIDLFVCNYSVKRTYIKDLELVFYNNNKELKKTVLKTERGDMNYLDIQNEEIVKILKLENNMPQNIVLCNIIDSGAIKDANKIILHYKNGKKKKRILIKKHFSIDNVEKFPTRESF